MIDDPLDPWVLVVAAFLAVVAAADRFRQRNLAYPNLVRGKYLSSFGRGLRPRPRKNKRPRHHVLVAEVHH